MFCSVIFFAIRPFSGQHNDKRTATAKLEKYFSFFKSMTGLQLSDYQNILFRPSPLSMTKCVVLRTLLLLNRFYQRSQMFLSTFDVQKDCITDYSLRIIKFFGDRWENLSNGLLIGCLYTS